MVVGIIGCGVLGSIQKKWLLKETQHEVLTYDIDDSKSNSTFESLAKYARFIFICVPTDSARNGDLNTIHITNAVSQIRDIDESGERKSIIIRSTVPVGYTRKLANEYPEYQFYFIPEFLTEKVAESDFVNNHQMIVGVQNPDEKEHAQAFEKLDFMPEAFDFRVVEFETAEMVKLATNAFYAMKVTFANELNDLCKKMKIGYDGVKDLLAINPRIGSSERDNQKRDVHLRIAQDGQPGYGGKCLPKDTKHLAQMMHKEKAGFGLLEKVVEINEKIR